MDIGFVGLGQMGLPMACRLARAGHRLVAFGRRPEAAQAIRAAGGTWSRDVSDAAGVSILFCCLPGDEALANVLFAEGFADRLPKSAMVVDLGTTGSETTAAIAARLSERGTAYLDAPVSGMARRAEEGTLTVMCGGAPEDFQRARALFDCLGDRVLHVGKVGAGQRMKLVNQLLFDVNAAALAEILPAALRLGLDPQQVADVVNSGTGRSYASEFFIPRIMEGRFSDGYPMADAYKDLVSGARLSAEMALPMPVLAAATATYQAALRRGHGDKDKGGMICVFEELFGVTFRTGPEKAGGKMQ